MVKEISTSKRKKPLFIRKDWHKRIKLGSQSKKLRKWRASKGRHGKIRLSHKGQSAKPKIGWGNDNQIKNLISGLSAVRVENVNDLNAITKGQGIIIARVGRKNREKIIEQANKMKLTILNKYLEKK